MSKRIGGQTIKTDKSSSRLLATSSIYKINGMLYYNHNYLESIIEKDATLNSNKNYNDLGINKPNKDV